MSSVCDAWVGKRTAACADVAAVETNSRALVSNASQVRSRRFTWAAMMSMTLVSGAMSTSTPSMVTMPRASRVNEGGNAKFCVCSTPNTSISAEPTLISARFTVVYETSRLPSWLSSRPWLTGPSERTAPSSASISAYGSFSATARNMRPISARSSADSWPTIPKSIHTMSSPRTRMLPGCGSAWKNPLSTICVTKLSARRWPSFAGSRPIARRAGTSLIMGPSTKSMTSTSSELRCGYGRGLSTPG